MSGYANVRRQWYKGNKRYLYNVHALGNVWRARMLAAIEQHPQLALPDKWIVDCRYIGRGPAVLKYLSCYL